MQDDQFAPKALRAAIVPVTPFQQNCTLLWNDETRRATVIDPGGDVDDIIAALAEISAEAEQIVLTHGHIDHAGGATELKARLERGDGRIPIVGPHEADCFLLEGLEEQARMFGLPPAAVRNAAPDRWLREGDRVEMGGVPFAVLHCPGHSPGSVVFVSPPERLDGAPDARDRAGFAIVGDVLFQGSIGRTDLPGGDHAALIRSITTKLLPLGDDIAFLCGHGPGSTFGDERRSNPFLRAERVGR